MATHSGILAWEIPWTEHPGELQSMGSERVGHKDRKSTRGPHDGPPNCSYSPTLQMRRLRLAVTQAAEDLNQLQSFSLNFSLLAVPCSTWDFRSLVGD